MKKWLTLFLVICLLAFTMFFVGCNLYTVVPMEEEREEVSAGYAEQTDKDLDPDAYVEGVWTDLVEYTVSNAYPLEDVYNAYTTDKEKCIKDFVSSDITEADTATFIVTGQVKVLEINRDSKAGKMGIDIAPYDDVVDAYVQIGAVYKGNTVRDAIPFITFEQFKNQLAFGDVGKAVNAYIENTTVAPFGVDDKLGEEIIVTGIFPDGDGVLITPVVLEPGVASQEAEQVEEQEDSES